MRRRMGMHAGGVLSLFLTVAVCFILVDASTLRGGRRLLDDGDGVSVDSVDATEFSASGKGKGGGGKGKGGGGGKGDGGADGDVDYSNDGEGGGDALEGSDGGDGGGDGSSSKQANKAPFAALSVLVMVVLLCCCAPFMMLCLSTVACFPCCVLTGAVRKFRKKSGGPVFPGGGRTITTRSSLSLPSCPKMVVEGGVPMEAHPDSLEMCKLAADDEGPAEMEPGDKGKRFPVPASPGWSAIRSPARPMYTSFPSSPVAGVIVAATSSAAVVYDQEILESGDLDDLRHRLQQHRTRPPLPMALTPTTIEVAPINCASLELP